MNSQQTFKKGERISSQKEIDLLFSEGYSYMAYPLRIVYAESKPFSTMHASILISVPKKRFKRAVKRNRMKRLIREAYRQNKSSFIHFLEEHNKGVLIAFLFSGNELASYSEIETAIKKALKILQEKLS